MMVREWVGRLEVKLRVGLSLVLACACCVPLGAADFVVLSPFDSGGGTLRQAILDANNDVAGAPHRILFNLPGLGVRRIQLASTLPAISATVTVDGFSQPGALPNTQQIGNDAVLLVEIDGSALDDGDSVFELLGEDSHVRGLALFGLPGIGSNAVNLRAQNLTVDGCYLGLTAAGVVGGIGQGVQGLNGTDGHRIGGALPAQRNVISGHRTAAVNMSGSGHTIQGNYIGTDLTGETAAGGSAGAGIQLLFATSNTRVGGLSSGEGNVLAGLSDTAIKLTGRVDLEGAGNRIEGNLIGTDATGTRAIPTSGAGVVISENQGAAIVGNTIGNLILPSLTAEIGAIDIVLQSSDTMVSGNRIGLGLDGSPMPNEGAGIRVIASSDTLIGGPTPSQANIVTGTYGTPGVGVMVYEVQPVGGALLPANRNSIIGNSIYGNAILGMDLATGPVDLTAEGVTPNDPRDEDLGPNQLQNTAQILQAVDEGASWRLTGTLESAPNSQFEVQLFSNSSCHRSGVGEGENFLGATQTTTDANGFGVFEAIVAPPPATHRDFSALTTDAAGNTSEFGPCLVRGGIVAVPTTSLWAKLVFTLLLITASWRTFRSP